MKHEKVLPSESTETLKKRKAMHIDSMKKGDGERFAFAVVIVTGLIGLLILLWSAGIIDLSEGITGSAVEETTEINQAPIAVKTNLQTPADTPLSVDLSEYFTDPEGQQLTFLAAQEDVISVSIDGTTATFTPAPGFSGERTLTIIATDGENVVRAPVKMTVGEGVTTPEQVPEPEPEAPAAISEPIPLPPEESGGFGGQGFTTQDTCGTCAACQTCMATPGTLCSLTASISSADTCIEVTGSNTILNCSGFTIGFSSNAGNNEYGINISHTNSVTIKDCIIRDLNSTSGIAYGVYLFRTNGTVITNNTIHGNASTATLSGLNINRTIIANNTFINSPVEFNPSGIIELNNVTNNNITNTTLEASFVRGFVAFNTIVDGELSIQASGSGSVFYKNNVTRFSNLNNIRGVDTDPAGPLTLIGNIIRVESNGTGVTGIRIAATGMNLTNNTVIVNGSRGAIGILIDTSSQVKANHTNITINGNGSAIFLDNTLTNVSALENTIFNNPQSWINSTSDTPRDFINFTNTTFLTPYGSIRFPGMFQYNATAELHRGKLNISSNIVRVNSSNLSFLNQTAIITLNGISFTDPQPTVDRTDSGSFVACLPNADPFCTELSYSGGVFVYNTSHFTQFSSQENSTGCGTCAACTTCMATNGNTCGVTADLLSNDTCIQVTGSDTVFNCAGFRIVYAINGTGTVNEHAINISSAENVTIRDCVLIDGNITNGNDQKIRLSGANYSTIINVTFAGNASEAIRDVGSHNVSFLNNLMLDSTFNLGTSTANWNITNNILNNSAFNVSNILTGAIQSLFAFNIIEATNNAVFTQGSSPGTEFTHNNFTVRSTGVSTAINLDGALGINFRNNLVVVDGNSTQMTGINIRDATTLINITNNTIIINSTAHTRAIDIRRDSIVTVVNNNITFIGPLNTGAAAIRISETGTNGTSFHNNTFFNAPVWINYTINGADTYNFTNTTFQTPNGSIRIPGTFKVANESKAVTHQNLNVTFNNAFMNSTNLSFMNQSAVISLNGITFSDPQPTVDRTDSGSFVACLPGSDPFCTELSFSGGVFVYNTSHFTSFSSQETSINLSTGSVTINESTTLVENIVANDTGIIINGSNTTLDCAGFSIFYNANGGDNEFGVLVVGRRNITIKDCLIRDINATGGSVRGIRFTAVNASTIVNNTIFTNGTTTNTGILFDSNAQGNLIVNNTMRTKGNQGSNVGIIITSNNTVDRNTIVTNGTSNNNGLNVDSDSNVTHNNITAEGNGSSNIGINPSGVKNNIRGNTIRTNGTEGNTGITISSGAVGNTMSFNNITASGSTRFNYGIETQDTTDGLIITDNIVSAAGGGSDNEGIRFSEGDVSTISRNTVSARGTNNSHGITISNLANRNNFTDNNITTTGAFNYAIFIFRSNASNISNNILDNPGQWINSSANSFNNITNTTFLTPSGSIRIIPQRQINGSQDVTRSKLNITSNNAFLNSSNLTLFNTSAVIELNSIVSSDPQPTVDFEDDGSFVACLPNADPFCTELSFTGGVFVYNTSHFTQFSSQESATANITSCPVTINESTTLTQNLISNNTCIIMGADNITLNCAGFSIGGNNTGAGINATGRLNITIRDCFIQNFSTGINLTVINNSIITNTTVLNATLIGVVISAGFNNVIANSTVQSNASQGILVLEGNNNTVINNNITSIAQSGISLLLNTGNNTLMNNVVLSTAISSGAISVGSFNNQLINNTGTGTINVGIIVSGSFNVLANNTWNSTSNAGITVSGVSNNFTNEISESNSAFGAFLSSGASRNRFVNTTFATNASDSILFQSAHNNTFFNSTLRTNVRWLRLQTGSLDNNLTNTMFSGENGSIVIPGNFTPPGGGSGTYDLNISNLNVTFNNAFLNSVRVPYLNQSAIISLNGILSSDPQPTVDREDDGSFVACLPNADPFCTELSFTGGVFVYNTSHFTSFSSQETAASITACAQVNASTTLTQNLISNASCITIRNTGNLTVNCASFNITYGLNSSINDTIGINVTNSTNVTIINCNLKKENVSVNGTNARAYGINAFGVTNLRVENSTIRTNGTLQDDGIRVTDLATSSIFTPAGTVTLVDFLGNPNNAFCTNATSTNSCQPCFSSANVACAVVGQRGCPDGESIKTETVLTFNTTFVPTRGSITVIGGEKVRCSINGVQIFTIDTRNNCGTLRSANFTTGLVAGQNNLTCTVQGSGGEEDNGFKLSKFSYVNPSSTTAGTLTTSNRAVINNVTIVTSKGPSNTGIFLNAPNSNVTDSRINATGNSSSLGIRILAENVTVVRSVIRTIGGNRSHAIELAARNAIIENNTINTSSGTESHGITISGVSGSRIANNTVSASSPNSDAIKLFSASGNTFSNNTIITATHASAFVEQSLSNVFTDSYFPSSPALSSLLIQEADGIINYTQPVNLSVSTNLSRVVSITLNRTFVNTTDTAGAQLNRTALLSFFGIVAFDINPVFDIDDDNTFEDCPATRCSNPQYNSSSGIFTFNASSFTTYSGQSLFNCGVIDLDTAANETNLTFVLQRSINSTGTCLTIPGENITVTCNNSIIFYDLAGVGSNGITSTGGKNLRIENCTIRDINDSGSSGRAIDLLRANSSIVRNVTIFANGTLQNIGIYVSNTSFLTITQSRISTFNTATLAQGIHLFEEVHQSNITGNIIFANSTGSASAVTTRSNSSRILLANNTLSTTNESANNWGVLLTTRSANITIVDNNITTGGTSAGNGVDAEGGSAAVMDTIIIHRNIIYTNGSTSNSGVEYGYTRFINITYNNIISGGIGINAGFRNFPGRNIIGNNITTNRVGINDFGSNSSLVANNTIIVNANSTTNPFGIEVDVSRNNLFIGNRIFVSGGSKGYGIEIDGHLQNNTFNHTNITVLSSGESFGIYFEFGNSNLTRFTNLLLNQTTKWIGIKTTAATRARNTSFADITFNEVNGSIRILQNFTINDSNSTELNKSHVAIPYNRAFVNSLAFSLLNQSAQITLRGIPGTSAFPAFDDDDDGTFLACAPPRCVQDSFTGGEYVFNVTRFTTYSSSSNLTTCGLITTNSTLKQNLLANGTCITIDAVNVTLDCSGFSIIGNGTGTGVNVTGRNNVTIRDCIIQNFTTGILLKDSERHQVINNTVNIVSQGIALNGTSNATISRNNLTSPAGNAVVFESSTDNNLTANTLATNTGSAVLAVPGPLSNAALSDGFEDGTLSPFTSSGNAFWTANQSNPFTGSFSAQSGSITDDQSTVMQLAFTLPTPGTISFARNVSTEADFDFLRFFIDGVQQDSWSGNLAFETVSYPVTAGAHNFTWNYTKDDSASEGNDTVWIDDVTITISIATASKNNRLNQTIMFSNTTWISMGENSSDNVIDNATFASSSGSIRLLPAISIPNMTEILASQLNVTSNNAYLNSTNLSFLNQSAVIELLGIGFTDPGPTVDFNDDGSFASCTAGTNPFCTELSFSGGVFVYNTSHFTHFSSQESSTAITACPVTINSSTTLTQNIQGSGTCVTIGNDSVTLNCANFSIFYDSAGTGGDGIVISSRANVTVENCTIVDINASGSTGIGISVTTGTGIRLRNNVIKTNGTANNYGIFAQSTTTRSQISNNTVVTKGSSGGNTGIFFDFSHHNNITDNNVMTNGTTANHGIVVQNFAANNTVQNNTIITNGSSSFNTGITLFLVTVGNRISQNNIRTDGTDFNIGMLVRDFSGTNHVDNNSIRSFGSGSSNYGVSVETVVSRLNLSNNVITTNGTNNNYGIFVTNISTGILIWNNTITTGGSEDANYGVRVFNFSTAIIARNIIRANGDGISGSSSSIGVRLESSTVGSTVDNNTIITHGGGAFNYGIDDSIFGANMSNNRIFTNGTSENHGIILTFSIESLVKNNTVNVSGSETDAIQVTSANTNVFENNTLIGHTRYAAHLTSSLRTTFNRSILPLSAGSLFVNETDGSILWKVTLNVTNSTNLSQVLNISQNFIRGNTTDPAGNQLNYTAELKFRSITFTDPVPIVDLEDDGIYIDCTPATTPACIEIEYSEGTFTYNVTHFTTYSSAEGNVNLTLTKTDSPDPVNSSSNLSYTIIVNVTSDSPANITLTETYPDQAVFLSAQPTPLSGTNNTFIVGNLTSPQAFSVNITLFVLNLSNGTLINNTANISFSNSTGALLNATVTESTTVAGIPVSAPPAAAPGQGGGSGGRGNIIVREPEVEAPTGTCIENWACEGWSRCENGAQTRICVDISQCNTTSLMPATRQACAMPIAAFTPEPEPEPFVPAVLPKPELAEPQEYDDLLQAIIMAVALLALAMFFIVSARNKYQPTEFVKKVAAPKPAKQEDDQEMLTLFKQQKSTEKTEKIDVGKLAKELAETHKLIEKFRKKH